MIGKEEHLGIARLYQSPSPSQMGKIIFELISRRIPHEMLFIAFLPLKFELPALSSVPKYQAQCDAYIRDTNKYDIWLRRSPVGPSVKTVRHSEHTPLHILKRSAFYREVMAPANVEYGASLVAWHGNQWLATLTVFRNAGQGDLTDAEMEELRGWQVHFEAVVQRLALAKEKQLAEDSFSTALWNLPFAAFFMTWDLEPGHATASGVELSNAWRLGLSSLARKSPRSRLVVPAEILEATSSLKPKIAKAKLARPGPVRRLEFGTVLHLRISGLSAKIYFIPSKSLSLSRGQFLVELHLDRPEEVKGPVSSVLSRLSRSERKVALEVAKGHSNGEIARRLGKSVATIKAQLTQAFKKLKVNSRVKLATKLSGASS